MFFLPEPSLGGRIPPFQFGGLFPFCIHACMTPKPCDNIAFRVVKSFMLPVVSLLKFFYLLPSKL